MQSDAELHFTSTLAAERDGVAKLLLSLTHSADLAEDAVQDAYVRALESSGPRSGAAASSWLIQIARRALSNRLRGDRRRGDRDRLVGEEEVRRRGSAPAAGDVAAEAELRDRFRDEVRALPEPHRSALQDRYFEGLSGSQVAERDGQSVETVKSRVVRARAALLERLERRGAFGDQHWTVVAAPILARSGEGGIRAAATGVGAAAPPAALPAALPAEAIGSSTWGFGLLAAYVAVAAAVLVALVWVAKGSSVAVGPSGALPADSETSEAAAAPPDGPGVGSSAERGRAPGSHRAVADLVLRSDPSNASPEDDSGSESLPTPKADGLRVISGRVVTRGGSPVKGAAIRGFPRAGGSGLVATSGDNGGFTADLPEDDAFTLAVTHSDYVPWGDTGDKSRLFEGGAPPLRIVLEALPRVTFEVVDAETDAPVLPDALEVAPGKVGEALPPRRPSLPRALPPGSDADEHERGARAGIDWVLVQAGGYQPFFGVVEAGPGGVQTIRLSRGGILTGRVVFQDEPALGASVELARGWWDDGVFLARDEALIRTVTGPEGRFEAVGLQPGEPYRLRALSLTGPMLERRDIRVTASAPLDLGDLRLQSGGIVDGQVTAPVGVELGGLKVQLGGRSDKRNAVTDADGSFVFTGVMPGHYAVRVGDRPGVLERGARADVAVHSGEVSSVVVDIGSHLLMDVSLMVEVAGIAVPGVTVQIVPVDLIGGDATAAMMATARLGRTDGEGRVRARARAMGEGRVQIYSPSIGHLYAEGPALRLDPALAGAPAVEQTVTFALGQMEFRLPAAVSLPEEGGFVVDIEAITDTHATLAAQLSSSRSPRQYLMIPVKDGRPRIDDDPFLRWESGRWSLLGVVPGTKTVRVHAYEAGAPKVRTELPNGSTRFGPARIFELTGQVTIRAGEEARLQLE